MHRFAKACRRGLPLRRSSSWRPGRSGSQRSRSPRSCHGAIAIRRALAESSRRSRSITTSHDGRPPRLAGQPQTAIMRRAVRAEGRLSDRALLAYSVVCHERAYATAPLVKLTHLIHLFEALQPQKSRVAFNSPPKATPFHNQNHFSAIIWASW